ncbi:MULTISPECIES: hypothetical protein [Dyella]|uniref:Uncharacterized protein n=2 Tax=Dyella TaxID=231454 RepID=A0A4V2NKV6_9GAMM|nr:MULTISPECIES: hypothetical protein [Dyella]TBR36159.1 hypothetical protein EYV96_16325 [Dyella terrae]TCI06208.1 hypothetical protein EZM97_35415 [Dyella soli]
MKASIYVALHLAACFPLSSAAQDAQWAWTSSVSSGDGWFSDSGHTDVVLDGQLLTAHLVSSSNGFDRYFVQGVVKNGKFTGTVQVNYSDIGTYQVKGTHKVTHWKSSPGHGREVLVLSDGFEVFALMRNF